ncbi:hypothetical protein JXA88_00470 [Candidatus Fermentibacteria bacterium]|nr:hypothetical protein [Candidatus Fermentibacteria bacterium]
MNIARFVMRDLPYHIGTMLLAGTIVAARISTVGLHGGEKTMAVVLYGIALTVVVAVYRHRRRIFQGPFAWAWYVPWFPLIGIVVFRQFYSIVPRMDLLVAVALVAVIDARHVRCWWAGLMLSGATILLMIRVIDLAWGTSQPEVVYEKQPPDFVRVDTDLGYAPKPDLSVRITCHREDTRLYEVVYQFDEHARRRVTGYPGSACSRHVIFTGGSSVFGEYLNDDETLPSLFQALRNENCVYNYGFSGYGPQQMLVMLRSGRLRAEVPQRGGLLLCEVIPDHINRARGSYATLAWASGFPRFVRRDGGIVRDGTFASSRPGTLSLFNLLRSSRSLDYLAKAVDRTVAFHPRQWGPFLDIVTASKDAYLQQSDGGFFAYLWPDVRVVAPSLSDSLTARGVDVIDLAEWGVMLPRVEQLVPFDPHPSGEYNGIIARALATALSPPKAAPPAGVTSLRGITSTSGVDTAGPRTRFSSCPHADVCSRS